MRGGHPHASSLNLAVCEPAEAEIYAPAIQRQVSLLVVEFSQWGGRAEGSQPISVERREELNGTCPPDPP